MSILIDCLSKRNGTLKSRISEHSDTTNLTLKIRGLQKLKRTIYGEISSQVKMIHLSNLFEKMTKAKNLDLDLGSSLELKWREFLMNSIDRQFQMKM